MRQFVIVGKGKGTYNTGNPITEHNLLEIGSSEATTGTSGPKPVKDIGSNDLINGVYSVVAEDQNFWLDINVYNGCIVEIDMNTFGDDFELEGNTGPNTDDNVTVRMKNVPAPNGGTQYLYYPATMTNVVAARGVFGYKYKGGNTGMLFGSLIPS